MSKIVPRLHDIECLEWDGTPVRTRKPMSFALTVEIGHDGGRGVDLFRLSICNPAFLSEEAEEALWVWRSQMLVLETLSLENVRAAIEQKISALAPYESWPEFGTKMAPYMEWEFAGQPPPFA